MCKFKHHIQFLVQYQNYFKNFTSLKFDLKIFSVYGHESEILNAHNAVYST